MGGSDHWKGRWVYEAFEVTAHTAPLDMRYVKVASGEIVSRTVPRLFRLVMRLVPSTFHGKSKIRESLSGGPRTLPVSSL